MFNSYSFPYNQTWECGFTPKCCSCKFIVITRDSENGLMFFCTRQKKYFSWNHFCYYHVWKFADSNQLDLFDLELTLPEI